MTPFYVALAVLDPLLSLLPTPPCQVTGYSPEVEALEAAGYLEEAMLLAGQHVQSELERVRGGLKGKMHCSHRHTVAVFVCITSRRAHVQGELERVRQGACKLPAAKMHCRCRQGHKLAAVAYMTDGP